MSKLTGLSLFSNVGVAEAYFEQIGVDIVLANELLPERARFYADVYKHTEMICGDICDETIRTGIVDSAIEKNVNFIIATPPCQGMSKLGSMNPHDARNQLIYYAVDVAFISDNIEKFNGESFKLANDIDMSTLAGFKPVGGTAVAFSGVFDGCGHTISGLTVSGTSKAALFGALENATVKNLVIDGAHISAAGSYAGVMAGQLNSDTVISNITVTNSTVSAQESFAGALAGSVNGENVTVANVKIENSSVTALNNAGGVFGFVEGKCAVTNSEVGFIVKIL